MSEHNYSCDDGPLPDDVTAQFDAPTEWDRLDPLSVRRDDSFGLTKFYGIVDGRRAWVSDRGHVTNADYYDHVRQLSDDALPSGSDMLDRKPFTYNDDINVVHHDHYAEHVTKVIVVLSEHQQVVLGSRSGALWWNHLPERGDVSDAPTDVLRAAVALSDGSTPFETPDGFSKVVGGWHSSKERSEQSAIMNELTSGNVPPEWTDGGNDPFPYIVRYGDTRNVCAVNGSVYAYHEDHELFEQLFNGTRARPGYAGFA